MKNLIFIFMLMSSLALNAQEILTYKGKYPGPFYTLYAGDPTATYTYYENEDMTRVYHGYFSMKFSGDGSINGSITGNFEHGLPNGKWTFVYPRQPFKEPVYICTMTCDFKEGKLNGPVVMTVVNKLKKTEFGKAVVNYSNGVQNGEVSFYTKEDPGWMLEAELMELKGQYDNGKKSGIWTYECPKGKGKDNYDKDEHWLISKKTGERISNFNVSTGLHALDILNVKFDELLVSITDIAERSALPMKSEDGIQTYEKANPGSAGTDISGESEFNEEIFKDVDKPAEFPGGQPAQMKWLSQKLKYPKAAEMNDVQGRVIVKFIVDKDGHVRNPQIVKGVDSDLDREALRIVKNMPDWQPAKKMVSLWHQRL